MQRVLLIYFFYIQLVTNVRLVLYYYFCSHTVCSKNVFKHIWHFARQHVIKENYSAHVHCTYLPICIPMYYNITVCTHNVIMEYNLQLCSVSDSLYIQTATAAAGRWTDGFKFSTPRLPLLYYNILLLYSSSEYATKRKLKKKKNRYKTKYFKWQRRSCAVAAERARPITIVYYYIILCKSLDTYLSAFTYTCIYRPTREYDELNAACETCRRRRPRLCTRNYSPVQCRVQQVSVCACVSIRYGIPVHSG